MVDCLFVTLFNILFIGNSYSLDSKLVLGAQCYNIEKTGLSCAQVILDCKQIRSREKLYLCTKAQLYFA